MPSTTTQPRRLSFRAREKAPRTARTEVRSSPTPRPWLPSSGFTTTGNPMRLAASAASSAVRTILPGGTGSPADSSSCRVSCLSPAMSTARAEVFDVIVARMRCWYFPWPSCTRDWSFSRM